MTTTWEILIDWDRDGSYSGPYDDVTSRVMLANWFVGFRDPYKDTAENSLLALVLNNADRFYSPDFIGGSLYGKLVPQRPVKIISQTPVVDHNGNPVVDGSGNPVAASRTMWLGWIDTIQPKVGRYGERTVQIVATGPMAFLKAAEANLPLQENRRSDEIVNLLVQQVVMPPSLTAAWVLGHAGNSELGTNTYLANVHADSLLEAGKLTLGLAADNWIRRGGPNDLTQDNFDVYHAIGDVTAAEHGRFFFDREGRARFWNRHHLLYEQPAKAALNDTMVDMTYSFAGSDQVKNEVIVICHPRKISATADNVLWDLGDSTLRVKAGEKETMYLKFQDGDGNQLAGRDITVNNLEFQQGTALATLEDKATGTYLHLDNSAGSVDAIIKSCTIKGRKITDYDHLEAKSTDDLSVSLYGKRVMRINLPSIDSLEKGKPIADYEIIRRKDPRGLVQAVTLRSHGTRGGDDGPTDFHLEQLTLTLGDRVDVTETQSGHDASYYIIGEVHKLSDGAARYETTWYLEPTPDIYPWRLGYDRLPEFGVHGNVLSGNTYLAY